MWKKRHYEPGQSSNVPDRRSLKNEIREKTPVTVTIHFLRHEERGLGVKNDDIHVQQALDAQAELTPEAIGRMVEKSKAAPSNVESAYAAGSSRTRSGHTALLAMGGHTGVFDSPMSFSEAARRADEELKGAGHKTTVFHELGFYNGTDRFATEAKESYRRHEYLQWLINQSDHTVLEEKDQTSTSFSRSAAGIASLVARQLKTAETYYRQVNTNPEVEKPNAIERFYGSHHGVIESFVVAALRKSAASPDKAEKSIEHFLKLLAEQNTKDGGNGFGYAQGFEVKIVDSANEETITVEGIAGLEPIVITRSMLNEIINDANELDKKIATT